MSSIRVSLDRDYSMSTSTNTRPADMDEATKAKFYTQSGWLSLYSLACGYGESAQGYTLTLDGVFHVRNLDNHLWLSYDTVGEARRVFTRLVKASLLRELEEAAIAERNITFHN